MKYFISILFLCIYFNTLFAQDTYYWVGGPGNWSDLNHWQLENGTTPLTTPYEINPVVFNENSFVSENDYVNIDLNNIYCKDMIWENIPFNVWFSGSDSITLFVYGSLTFHENVINDFQGIIYFDGIESASKIIEPNGVTFNGEIRFQGINSDWTLTGDLIMNDSALFENLGKIVLEHGGFITNGHDIYCSSFHSNYTSTRTLDIQNSTIHLYAEGEEKCWDVNMENLTLLAEGSTIIIYNPLAKFTSFNGNNQFYETLLLIGLANKIENSDGTLFQKIQVDGDFCQLSSNINIDSLIINGDGFELGPEIIINNLVVNAEQFSLPQGMYIKRLVVDDHFDFLGSNHIEYARLSGNINFYGDNTFDTLVLLPQAVLSGVGSTFKFQSGSTQEVFDSLYIRGNQCSNITIENMTLNSEVAFIKKELGQFDIVCDYLRIYNVGAESETLNFYAGENSLAYPDPNNPPPGWIFEDPSNYLYGFQGATYEACWGEPYILDASSFNGNLWTEYYWNNDTVPGEITYTVYESQIVNIRVVYAEECYYEDYAIIEFDSCESNINTHTLNKLIRIYPNPSNGTFIMNTQNLYGDFYFCLYTLIGEMVFNDRISIEGDVASKNFDFSHLNKGIYYALISNKGNVAAKKIVIQ